MSAAEKKTYAVIEVAKITGLDHPTLVMFIQREWICPQAEDLLDEEDLARVQLIREIREIFGANDEAISLILHLMDQIYHLRNQIRHSDDAPR